MCVYLPADGLLVGVRVWERGWWWWWWWWWRLLLQVGTQVLVIWVWQGKCLLLQHVLHLMNSQPFFAWFPQSWHLLNSLPFPSLIIFPSSFFLLWPLSFFNFGSFSATCLTGFSFYTTTNQTPSNILIYAFDSSYMYIYVRTLSCQQNRLFNVFQYSAHCALCEV